MKQERVKGMQFPQRIFFSDNDDNLPKDDIDELFDKLQRLEPPPYLISRILSLLPRKLPTPSPSDSLLPPSGLWDELDNLVVRNDKRQTC